MINYNKMFYLLSDITINQEHDYGTFRTRLTPYQLITDVYIHGSNYDNNKEWILVLK